MRPIYTSIEWHVQHDSNVQGTPHRLTASVKNGGITTGPDLDYFEAYQIQIKERLPSTRRVHLSLYQNQG